MTLSPPQSVGSSVAATVPAPASAMTWSQVSPLLKAFAEAQREANDRLNRVNVAHHKLLPNFRAKGSLAPKIMTKMRVIYIEALEKQVRMRDQLLPALAAVSALLNQEIAAQAAATAPAAPTAAVADGGSRDKTGDDALGAAAAGLAATNAALHRRKKRKASEAEPLAGTGLLPELSVDTGAATSAGASAGGDAASLDGPTPAKRSRRADDGGGSDGAATATATATAPSSSSKKQPSDLPAVGAGSGSVSASSAGPGPSGGVSSRKASLGGPKGGASGGGRDGSSETLAPGTRVVVPPVEHAASGAAASGVADASATGGAVGILAYVVRYLPASHGYEVEDAEDHEEGAPAPPADADDMASVTAKKRYVFPAKDVLPVPVASAAAPAPLSATSRTPTGKGRRAQPSAHQGAAYPVGKVVLALYPETTCFYRASVAGVVEPGAAPTTATAAAGSADAGGERRYVLQFEDDNGIEHLVSPSLILDPPANWGVKTR
ncbi:hypothetical protein CXG81DRAFT_20153 [Caulochytrium protostelioides]|uniref:SGF29 C-terminal domain-containing protein n=1 Tax=Caulochytrium protostelioides TaxID=1555241 RepID=A0A4P9X443_9FUNG|nr:hypothetical protein CXG81DRAFT_20153 [Caulochytrium protostelioides]|eukprot:RKO99800.1 hypothetical protein CXG81DRAFT_20153 [Caulochytrium protostelioides]